MYDINAIITLAQDVELGDPIDWSTLNLDRDTVYMMLASSVLDHANTLDSSDRELILLSTLVKMVVENFALNLRLRSK